MRPRFIASNKVFNPGDGKVVKSEERVENVDFTVHKFSDRPRPPERHRNIYFSCFSEFGCEVVATCYCIPRLVGKFPDYYYTAVGWYGRAYMYRHLVDEYWEIDEKHQNLREYCRAFHHDSKNLKKVQEEVKKRGILTTANYMNRQVLGTQCEECGNIWTPPEKCERCVFCDSPDVRQPLFRDIRSHRDRIVYPPPPSGEKIRDVGKYLGVNPVAVFARGRKCYGRNLQPEFYVKLIGVLREMGYDPIWLGEKSTTQPCPVAGVVDFSRMPEAGDLETTLAIVSRCKFTAQFWTASTRLAAMVGTPYLLFESPEQLWGVGQEGMRLDLVTKGRKKVSANDFLSIHQDNDGGLAVFEECVHEMETGNDSEHVGLVGDRASVYHYLQAYKERAG